MQIRTMADNNLLLVAIPEDTRKSQPIYIPPQKSLKLYCDMIFFLPDLGRNISGFGLSLQNKKTEPL